MSPGILQSGSADSGNNRAALDTVVPNLQIDATFQAGRVSRALTNLHNKLTCCQNIMHLKSNVEFSKQT